MPITLLSGATGAGKTMFTCILHGVLGLRSYIKGDSNKRFEGLSGHDLLVFMEFDNSPSVIGLLNLLADQSLDHPPIKGSYVKVPIFKNKIICSNDESQELVTGRGPVPITLLCGATGAGKTLFTRVLTQVLGLTAYIKGDTDKWYEGLGGHDLIVFEELDNSPLIIGMLNLLADQSLDDLPIKGSHVKIPTFQNFIICFNNDPFDLFAGRGVVLQQAVRRRVKTVVKFKKEALNFVAEMEMREDTPHNPGFIKSAKFVYPSSKVLLGVLDIVYTYILWAFGLDEAQNAQMLLNELANGQTGTWAPKVKHNKIFDGVLNSENFY